MRGIVFGVFVATLMAGGSAAAATRIADPEAFVREVYRHIEKAPRDYREPDDIYSPRLDALFALDRKEAGGEVGRIDFDFWTNAQDSEISKVRVTSRAVEKAPSREIVTASFVNVGRPEIIAFYFEKTRDGWKLDDASSLEKNGWTLSLVLKYGWLDEQ